MAVAWMWCLETAVGQPTESNTHVRVVVRAGLVGQRLEIPYVLRLTIYQNDFPAQVTIGRMV
ncbi:hypothetical protein J6590_022991 [Homalodisca vitripennis]|nr:hypothetical protein J6590_022991 [Homalodisca vitripennis]